MLKESNYARKAREKQEIIDSPTIKVQSMPLFHTPSSPKEIHDWIEALPPEEKVIAYTVFGMTINLLVWAHEHGKLDIAKPNEEEE